MNNMHCVQFDYVVCTPLCIINGLYYLAMYFVHCARFN